MVETQQKTSERLTLQNVPYELFLEVMSSVPIEPKYADVIFLAHGIFPPSDIDNKEKTRYLNECREKGIVPFTTLEFGYNEKKGLFLPELSPTRYYNPSNLDEVNLLFKGGKNYRFEFRTKPHEFEEFKKNLPSLLQEDYKLMDADLYLTTYRLTGYTQGTYGDARIFLKSFHSLETDVEKRKLEVELGRIETSNEDNKKLINWFNILKEKYS